jgi:Protein of unknown function (DUF2778)
MRAYRKKTPVSRREKRLIRIDMGLIAASIGVLAAGFGFNLAGTHAINLAVSGGSQIPDRSGVRVSRLETDVGSAVGLTEGASEPLAASAPCAFDERFYFDQQTASFHERFASAFGSPGNAAGKAAADANNPDLGEQARRDGAITRSTAPRLASLRPERLNTAEAPTGLSLRLDADSRTAIYDIAARTVYLPNGHRLEAHSGLGSHLDDPRYVTTKMQGPTPPNVYSLTLRERLFHGVRALRLTPTDDGKMFGRAGILAHSYMLGPSGQSNGCVSFRNYPAFLSAFLKGEVDRLVVVDHLATTTGKISAASGG